MYTYYTYMHQGLVCSDTEYENTVYKIGNELIEAENCVASTCSLVLTEFLANVDEYYLSIVATNHSHTPKTFKTRIGE